MDDFDVRGHARLVGNVLLAFALLALAIAGAGWFPGEAAALPPHFFGSEGALVVALVLGLSGLLLRKRKP